MRNSNHILLLSVISIACGISCALEKERILGGIFQSPDTFKYHVTISSRTNGSADIILACSAAAIHKKFALGVAQCFFQDCGQLKDHAFYVLSGKFHMRNVKLNALNEIIKFYVPSINIQDDDITLLKVDKDMNLVSGPNVAFVDLPNNGDTFYNQRGEIAGYECGRDHFEIEGPRDDREYTDLKYSQVEVVYNVLRSNIYFDSISHKVIFGVLKPFPENAMWSLCMHEIGSPLVINNVVVGLASRISSTHTEGIDSSIYTNVAAYRNWIDMVVYKKPNRLPVIKYFGLKHVM